MVRPPLPPGLLRQTGGGRRRRARRTPERDGGAGVGAAQPVRLHGRRGAVGGARGAPLGRALGRRWQRRRSETGGKDDE